MNEKLWGKEVADAARFAEQARNGQEMSRMADFRTTQVFTDKVSEDTQKIIYELEEAISDLTRRNKMMAQESEMTPEKLSKNITFPIADGTVKLSGRDQVFQRST